MRNLPVQIRRLDHIAVYQANRPYSRAGQVSRGGTAQPAEAND
jgi:hypothetical protein